MTGVAAIKAALSLYHLPSSLRLLRSEPLPQDIECVLRVAAGDEALERELAAVLHRPGEVVRQAAEFYIEQILLDAKSDHYRVLGSTPEASAQELRRRMALLMSWLHPDKNRGGSREVFSARVATAWDSLRTPAKREAYDRALARPHGRHTRGSAMGRPVASPAETCAWSRPAPRVGRRGAFERSLGLLRRLFQSRSSI